MAKTNLKHASPWGSGLAVATALGVLASGIFGAGPLRAHPVPDSRSCRDDRFIVALKDGVSEDAFSAWCRNRQFELGRRLGNRINRRIKAAREPRLIHLPKGGDLEQCLQRMKESGLVEYAEPDYLLHAAALPNDPAFVNGSSWGLRNLGKLGGVIGADINAVRAWDIRTSAREIVVAVIDSGIRYTHEDLAPNMWVNSDEIPDNGIDEDLNGIVDDIHGYDAVGDDGDPMDELGHGTHVAGIIGAAANNRKGSVGVAWEVRLMALRFLAEDGAGSTFEAVRCIDYAVGQGAGVINASWGSEYYSRTLELAIERARRAGVIVVTAAGNEGKNLDLNKEYPAAYSLGNIVTVAGTDRGDVLTSSSNYGAATADLAAPSEGVYSCWASRDNAYRTNSGTSMAAPFVAGAFALLRAEFPEMNYLDLIRAVTESARPLSSLAGKTTSGGRLDVAEALSRLGAHYEPPKPPALKLDLSGGLTILEIKGEPHFEYRVDWSHDLRVWNVFSNVAVDFEGKRTLDVTLGDADQIYYRARPAP